MIDFEQEEQEVAALRSRLETLKSYLEREEQEHAKAQTKSRQSLDAQETLQHLAQAVQQQAHQKISEVVSFCLSAVFDDPYQFKIVFERKRGRTEAHLRFTRRNLDVDPLTASGGGTVDVAAFALRVACLVLHRPRLQRLVVLDEPMKFVSSRYRERVRQMFESVAAKMEMQIIMVTHIEELTTGKVVELN